MPMQQQRQGRKRNQVGRRNEGQGGARQKDTSLLKMKREVSIAIHSVAGARHYYFLSLDLLRTSSIQYIMVSYDKCREPAYSSV